jgi:MerR family transcriptional regulator/heat shock protein HspR
VVEEEFTISVEAASDAKVLIISVAARLAGMHPQTLRQYDRLGLVQPGRATGGGRRYSARDVALLREVQRLSQEDGVNLAGIGAYPRRGDLVPTTRTSNALVVWRPRRSS